MRHWPRRVLFNFHFVLPVCTPCVDPYANDFLCEHWDFPVPVEHTSFPAFFVHLCVCVFARRSLGLKQHWFVNDILLLSVQYLNPSFCVPHHSRCRPIFKHAFWLSFSLVKMSLQQRNHRCGGCSQRSLVRNPPAQRRGSLRFYPVIWSCSLREMGSLMRLYGMHCWATSGNLLWLSRVAFRLLDKEDASFLNAETSSF